MLRFPTHERLAADSRDAVAFFRGSDAMTVSSIIATPGRRLTLAAGRLPA